MELTNYITNVRVDHRIIYVLKNTYRQKGRNMDVSVIFATHNRQDVLNDVFDAWREVDKVTKYEYEIICSDDESTDNTVKIIENIEDLPVKLIRNKKGGASKARNAALKIATGKIVIFTGDDIFPMPEYINKHFENYLKYGENIATLGRIDWHPDIKINHLMRHITEIGCEQFGFIALPVYQTIDFRHFYTSNISVSMKLLKEIDYFFDTRFDKYGFEDIELGYRLQKVGMKIYYDPDLLAYHHHIYDSVEKFCNRQISAGEELVVFNQLQEDLYDKCNCDVNNSIDCFRIYNKQHKMKHSLKGGLTLFAMNFSKTISRLLEKVIDKTGSVFFSQICSLLYVSIFQNYFFYGVASRIVKEENVDCSRSNLMNFTAMYMTKPISEIYWNVGNGFNENDARKWRIWNSDEISLQHQLPHGVSEVRVAPLKDYCKAEVNRMYFVLKDKSEVEAKVEWHNACSLVDDTYDFSHTNDSCILIKNVPENYDYFIVNMKVKAMKKHNNLYKICNTFIRMLGIIKNKVSYKINNATNWKIKYSYGQRRRIQIGIGGDLSAEKRAEIIDLYAQQLSVLGEDVKVTDVARMERGYINYIYNPMIEALDETQILQVAYTLLNSAVDYIVVSRSFVEFPQIACKSFFDVLIYNDKLTVTTDHNNLENATGRYMRLPAYEREEQSVDIKDYINNVSLNEEYYLGGSGVPFRVSQRGFGMRKGDKPLIFVVPVFLAVGGVERNTIEVMKRLHEHYDFVLITFERHTKQQGSLHYQLKGLCNYIFDLREITEHTNFLEVFYELNEMFKPELLWLCNSSPWFENHISHIREIFKEIPMISQDVYDSKMGWIEYYKNKEKKCFDRYIAITELIKNTFVNEYHISSEKIDVIYSAVDDIKIKKTKEELPSREELCKKYNLDIEKEHYSYVARLTEQKNPIRYLELVKQIHNMGTESIQFVMVGDGVYRDKVEQYIQDNHLEDVIVRMPYIANTPEFISVLDGLVITSDYEGLPIVCIEAMSMGTPIISTNTGDTKRFIEQNRCGMIIDENIDDVSNFEMFRSNLSEFKKNAVACADEMLDFFSVTNVAQQYLQMFQDCK